MPVRGRAAQTGPGALTGGSRGAGVAIVGCADGDADVRADGDAGGAGCRHRRAGRRTRAGSAGGAYARCRRRKSGRAGAQARRRERARACVRAWERARASWDCANLRRRLRGAWSGADAGPGGWRGGRQRQRGRRRAARRANVAGAPPAAPTSQGGGDARSCAEGAVDPRSAAAVAWRACERRGKDGKLVVCLSL
jgi:hypothetical protein